MTFQGRNGHLRASPVSPTRRERNGGHKALGPVQTGESTLGDRPMKEYVCLFREGLECLVDGLGGLGHLPVHKLAADVVLLSDRGDRFDMAKGLDG